MSASSRKDAEATSPINTDNLAAIDKQLVELGLDIEDIAPSREGFDESSHDKAENVKVMLRCRPMVRSDEREFGVTVNEAERYVEIDKGRRFYFDATFGPQSDNDIVYMRSARHLVQAAFKGYNCTLFLYGQTGTGKTFTHSSITLSSFAHLFDLIRDSNKQSNFLIRASYYELYNEDIRDLLSSSNKPLELRESKARGVYVKDLACFLVNNVAELEKLKRIGDKRRAIAATKMNEHSSRSHSIFSITIETVVNKSQSSAKSSSGLKPIGGTKSAGSVKAGRIHMIDLAGSERQVKSGSTGARLKEASKINMSLTCLSLVIRALTDSKSNHVPYRNSKLTRLLSSSLGGNSKTMLIACVSPSKSDLDETLNTLRFASRTKRIKNTAVIVEDAKDALLRNYRRQIEELRHKLREQQSKSQSKSASAEDETIEFLVTSKDNSAGKPTFNDSNEEAILQQLRILRAKIMVGGENLLEKAEMHQRLLEASKAELEEKRNEEMRLEQELERRRKTIEKVAKVKGSLEGQVIDLDEKLRRSLLLYKRYKEEHRDLHSEHQQLKESLLQTIRSTSKEIKYADCIIDDFIPRDSLDIVNAHAQYDEDSGEWQIKYIALSGNNIAQTKRIASSNQQVPKAIPKKGDSEIVESDRPTASRSDPYIRGPKMAAKLGS